MGVEKDFMWLYGKLRQAGAARRGCVIHHLDWDKNNNDISNLCCLTVSEHEAVHNKIGGEAGKELGYKIAKERGRRSPRSMI